MLTTESTEAFEFLNANLALSSTSTPKSAHLARSFAMAALRLERNVDVQTRRSHEQIAKNPEITGALGTLRAMEALHQPGQAFPFTAAYEITTNAP